MKQLIWNVKNFDANAQQIKDYNILKYRENFINELKTHCATKEEFSDAFRKEMMYHYWSRAEYELIIKRTEDNHIILEPWVGCRNLEAARLDVTNDTNFNWKDFADKHIRRQVFGNEAKIDVWDQIEYQWGYFVNYCWNYHQRREK